MATQQNAPTFDGKGLGAIKQKHDPRDRLYGDFLHDHPEEVEKAQLPAQAVVPKDQAVPIYDQGNLGSCTANEACAHYQILQLVEGKPSVPLSRLQEYRNSRKLLGRGYLNQDSGATGRDAAKALATWGACPEELWPYDISKFTLAPPRTCTKAAGDHQLLQYLAIPERNGQTMQQLRTSLAAGYPVGFSIDVYDNFRPDGNGVIPMPAGSVRGGHRILLVGYDDATALFLVRNSWGAGWGLQGRCKFHYDHIYQHAGDFWTFRMVE